MSWEDSPSACAPATHLALPDDVLVPGFGLTQLWHCSHFGQCIKDRKSVNLALFSLSLSVIQINEFIHIHEVWKESYRLCNLIEFLNLNFIS